MNNWPKNQCLHCICLAILLTKCSITTGDDDFISPPENLVLSGIPPIPQEIADSVLKYTEGRSAGFSSWHPTEREMLIVTRFANAPQVHWLKTPMGARRQMTFFPEPVGGATFEPTKGEFFCFRKDSRGDEFYQIYRFDPATGDAALLTDGKKRNQGGLWSDSGKSFAYSRVDANEKGAFTELRAVDPRDPKTDRLLARLEGGGWGATDWSAYGTTIACIEYLSANDSNIWMVNAASGEKALLTPKNSGQRISYAGAQFSRDGKAIYTATDAVSEFQQLARINLATKQAEILTKEIPWDVEDFDLADDGKTLAFVTNEEGASRLRLLETASGKIRLEPNLPMGVIFGLRWHKNSRDLAFALATPRAPADVYSIHGESGQIERWTESETGGLDTSNLPEPEIVRWKSFDDRMISGFLNMPPKKFSGPRPVIINIHGGPEGQSRPSFLGRSNYYLNEMGVAILFPNVRGSSGYGKTFLDLDNGLKREDSYRDIEALLDWIATRGDLDPKRVMVTGGSYGGHMTLAIATRYPDRIACAVDVVGISNLRTFLQNTQGYRRDLRRAEYGDERDPAVAEFFDRGAPLTLANKISKPLFVIQGRNDPRVPISESDQMVETVREIGTPVWYLIANDEGHGFQKKPNQDFQFYATVMFIREHLLK